MPIMMRTHTLLIDFFNFSSVFLYCPFWFRISDSGTITKSTNRPLVYSFKIVSFVSFSLIRSRSVVSSFQTLLENPNDPSSYFSIVSIIINTFGAYHFLRVLLTKMPEIEVFLNAVNSNSETCSSNKNWVSLNASNYYYFVIIPCYNYCCMKFLPAY